MAAAAAPPMLWDVLDLGGARCSVLAIVGGGGKTALLYALGREAKARGKRAVLGGTTRFTRPAGAPPLVAVGRDPREEVEAALAHDPVVVVTRGFEAQERLGALGEDDVATLAALPGLGLLALEADGSRMRPFKAPGEHEPVIPAAATHVALVVGADAIDAPLDEAHVHRPERIRALLDGPAERCTICSIDVIARVLLHAEGGRRGAGERDFAVVVNKADVNPAGALALAAALIEGGAPRVVVTSLASAHPVQAVFAGNERGARRLR